MGTLAKALVYLICIGIGMLGTFIGTALWIRNQGPPCTAGPCDAAAMSTLSTTFVGGPLVGLVIGFLVVSWLDQRNKSNHR